MHPYLLIYLTNLAVNVILPTFLGLFLLFSTDIRKNHHARFSVYVSFAIVFWAFFNFLGLLSEDRKIAFTLIALSYCGLAFIPVSFLSLTSAFLDTFLPTSYDKYRFPFHILAYTSVFFILSDILLHSGFILSGLKDTGWTNLWPSPGVFFNAFLAYFSLAFTVSITWLILARGKTTGLIRKQLDYILWPSLISAVGGTSQFLILYDLPFNIIPIGGFAISIFVVGYFYAAARFHLFNAKVITAELFTITIWLVLFGKILFLPNPTQLPFDIGILILSIIFGMLTIQSVLTEVKQKDLLDDLNKNLQKKVDEQTKEIHDALEVEKRAHAKLQELDKAKTDFILAAQHNLRTPVTIIKGYIEKVTTSVKEGKSVDISEYLDKTTGVVDTMADLVNGLVDVTELEVGRRGFSKK